MNTESATIPSSEPEVVTHLDVSHLVTEDDTPVDNPFSEQQMRLLTHPLYASWKPGQPFVAMANVGLYFALNGQPLVPDTLVSVGVERPSDIRRKEHSAYFTWLYGKVPDIVVEIVSNREGGELDRKMRDYAFHGVPYYAVFDPSQLIQHPALQCFEIARNKSEVSYRLLPAPVFAGTGLGLVEWKGEFEGVRECWIRWVDADGNLILTGEEHAAAEGNRADSERRRADSERQRADSERERADGERHRVEALVARLRAAGLDPDSVMDQRR